ncbi:hypothetical protein [Virgibacillus salexigens]|uniref:DUF1440 domain-containing protein n=2 Tax=Virgibacillus TaxID=84406 RepID=A0ABQ2DD30_9BACI|nr:MULTISPECIES: hypothetical protein [Virgibacillus]GGJ53470.1 hypothetical protein GCM10007111_14630 [Virgibacillus kapii]
MRWITLTIIGAAAGLGIAAVLKLIQAFTEKQVYTLLLNVDYIPVLKDLSYDELGEVILHLLVSILLVPMLYIGLLQMNQSRNILAYFFCSSFIGTVLYTTTVFSPRTPNLFDGEAFLYWVGAHMIYGVIVGGLIIIMLRE